MGVVSHEHVLYDVVLLIELPYLLRLRQLDQRYLRRHLRTHAKLGHFGISRATLKMRPKSIR